MTTTCKEKTKKGNTCRKNSAKNSEYCHIHDKMRNKIKKSNVQHKHSKKMSDAGAGASASASASTEPVLDSEYSDPNIPPNTDTQTHTINETSVPILTKCVINPTRLNFQDERETRQRINILKVYKAIQNNDKKEFDKCINEKQLERYIKFLDITFDKVWMKAQQDSIYAKSISLYLAINATRQGSLDESTQFKICNMTLDQLGIHITKCSTNEAIPKEDGNIVSMQSKSKQQRKHKSFDGKLTGKMKGYVCAKIVMDGGGHQGSVFQEMYRYADWWIKHKKDLSEFLVLLIDTNLQEKFETLKTTYKKYKNILIFDHYEFQEYAIKNYSDESI